MNDSWLCVIPRAIRLLREVHSDPGWVQVADDIETRSWCLIAWHVVAHASVGQA